MCSYHLFTQEYNSWNELAMSVDTEFIEVYAGGKCVGIPLSAMGYNVDLVIDDNPNRWVSVRKIDKKTQLEKYKWTGSFAEMAKAHRVTHADVNINPSQNHIGALLTMMPNDVPPAPNERPPMSEEERTRKMKVISDTLELFKSRSDPVDQNQKKEVPTMDHCEVEKHTVSPKKPKVELLDDFDLERGEESQNAIIPEEETTPDEMPEEDKKYPFITKRKRKTVESDDENETSIEDQNDEADEISNTVINGVEDSSSGYAPSECESISEEEDVKPVIEEKRKREKEKPAPKKKTKKIPLPLYDATAREPCFTLDFFEGEATCPLELLPLMGKKEHTGMFYHWEVDGAAQFVNSGKKAMPWQEPTSDDLMKAYCGYSTTFGSYGLAVWKDMGLGKTTQAEMHVALTRRMKLPGKRTPIEVHKRELFHMLVDGTVKSEINRKLLKLNMFTPNMKDVLPDHPFKMYPNKRGHALLIVQNSVNTSWLSEIANNFVDKTFKYIDLINNSDAYKNNNRLATEIPSASLVIVGEGRLPHIKKDILEKLYPGMKNMEDKSACVMPEFDKRTNKVFKEGLGILYATAWNILIIDEAQSHRNMKSVRFGCTKNFIAHQVICLTGTPLQNKLEDLQAEFSLMGMSHCMVDNSGTFLMSVDTFRESEKKKLTVRMIDELSKQFQNKVATIRPGTSAMTKATIMEQIKHIIRTRSLASYNPARCLKQLFIDQLNGMLMETMKDKWTKSNQFLLFDYDLSNVFGLYPLFEQHYFGKDGIDMLSLDYPLLVGKANSGRSDHRRLSTKQIKRPDFVNEAQNFHPKPDTSDPVSAKIIELTEYIDAAEMIIKDGMLKGTFLAQQQEFIAESKVQLEELLAQKNNAKTAVDDYSDIWKVENELVFDMFTSYKKVMCCYTKGKNVDWDAIKELSIVDCVTLGISIFNKFQTNERFADVWNNAEKDTTWYTLPDVETGKTLSADAMLKMATENPLGFIWDRAVRRFGKDTLYQYCLKKEIEKEKAEKDGRDLTDEELKLVQDRTYLKYGTKITLVKSSFLTEKEERIYKMIHRKGITNIKKYIETAQQGGCAVNWGKLFAILTRLRQAAVDPRLLGEDIHIAEMLEMDKANGITIEGDYDDNDDEDGADNNLVAEIKGMLSPPIGKNYIQSEECTKLIMLKQHLTNPDIIGPEDKFLIFTGFVSFAYACQHVVHQIFGPKTCQIMTKDQNPEKRIRSVAQFNNDKSVRGFSLTLKVGGTGLNLQAAVGVFIMDPWWNPQMESQAMKRADRIGKPGLTKVFRFIIQDTVEEKVQEIKQLKTELNDSIFGANDEPCVLPTNNEMKGTGTISVSTLLQLAGVEDEVGIGSYSDMIKNRKKKKGTKSKRQPKLVVKKNKKVKKNGEWSGDIRNSGNFIVRKQSDSGGLNKDNFTQVTNQMRVDLEDSLMGNDESEESMDMIEKIY